MLSCALTFSVGTSPRSAGSPRQLNLRQGRQLWTYRVTNCFRRQLRYYIKLHQTMVRFPRSQPPLSPVLVVVVCVLLVGEGGIEDSQPLLKENGFYYTSLQYECRRCFTYFGLAWFFFWEGGYFHEIFYSFILTLIKKKSTIFQFKMQTFFS